jgi:hypothetical protein
MTIVRYLLLVSALSLATPAHAKRCHKDGDCPAGQHCTSPEEQSRGTCGKPHPGECPPGFVGDACGACWQTCKTNRDCPRGKSCRREVCESSLQCFPPKRPRP